MTKYLYGEAFEKAGVADMGRQASGWCGLRPDGVLVLMAHENFIKTVNGKQTYTLAGHPMLPTISGPAKKFIAMLTAYFAEDRPVTLLVGAFGFDGEITAAGVHKAAKFKYAKDFVFHAKLREFDPATGRLVCEVTDRRSL